MSAEALHSQLCERVEAAQEMAEAARSLARQIRAHEIADDLDLVVEDLESLMSRAEGFEIEPDEVGEEEPRRVQVKLRMR